MLLVKDLMKGGFWANSNKKRFPITQHFSEKKNKYKYIEYRNLTLLLLPQP